MIEEDLQRLNVTLEDAGWLAQDLHRQKALADLVDSMHDVASGATNLASSSMGKK